MNSPDIVFFRLILAVLIGATTLTGGVAAEIALGVDETLRIAGL